MKHHLPISLGLILILFSTPFTNGGSTAPAYRSIEEEVKAIKDEYWQQHRTAIEALQNAKTREEGMKLYIEKRPSPARCVERLLALAKPDPKSPGGFEALALAINFVDTAWNWKDEPVRRGDVVDLLLNNHVENPRIGETFRSFVGLDIESSSEILRQAAKRNPIREVRGQAVFYLAKDRAERLSLAEIIREVPTFKQGLERSNGKDAVAKYTAPNPKFREEAITLLIQAQREFADVKIDNEPIAALAEHILFRLRRLQVGQTAPDIIGVDQHGQPMKLSDYRGKVVAIVFWGSWCSMCMHEVPAERELVKRMQGKPFVLLGVNSDPRGKVDEVIEKHQINWRSWADGELEGPQVIAKAWDVRSWPQIYLLDGAGVIRYSELAYGTTGQDLGQAVDLLVSEATR